MMYRYVDKKKIGGIENIIKVYIDGFMFENSVLKKVVINKIKELRREILLFNGFQFPIVKIVATRRFEGLELYQISISKEDFEIETFDNVELFIESLSQKILSRNKNIVSSIKRCKNKS